MTIDVFVSGVAGGFVYVLLSHYSCPWWLCTWGALAIAWFVVAILDKKEKIGQ